MLFAYCRKVTLFLYVRVIETEQEHLKTETTLWNQREVTKGSWNTPKSSWVIFVFSKQILGCLIWHSPSMSKVLLLHFHFKVYVRKRGQLCNAVLNFFVCFWEKGKAQTKVINHINRAIMTKHKIPPYLTSQHMEFLNLVLLKEEHNLILSFYS